MSSNLNQVGGTPEQHLDEALAALIKTESAISVASRLTENVDRAYLEHLYGAVRIATRSLQTFMHEHPDGYTWTYSTTLNLKSKEDEI